MLRLRPRTAEHHDSPGCVTRVRAAEATADAERPQAYRWRLLRALYAVFRRRHGGASLLAGRVASARGRLDLLQSRPLQPTGEGPKGARVL